MTTNKTRNDDLYNADFAFLLHKKSRLDADGFFLNSHILPAVEVTILCCVNHCLINALLVDGTQTCCRNFQNYPFIPLRNIESLDLQVRFECSLGLSVWVWNVVSTDDLLTCNLTNSWHFSNILLFLFPFTKRSAKIQLFLKRKTFFLKNYFFWSPAAQNLIKI